MSVLIKSVTEYSPCSKKIHAGDMLVSIDGHEIKDVLDYMYYSAKQKLSITVVRDGVTRTVKIKKEQYEDLGLEFETYLMDREMHCKNKCIFCFIDQLPKGMREALYFKDDDARLSFLVGNYATLTNMSDQDIDRIIKLKISPINISVHATDPKVRVEMMKNPAAAKCYDIMKRFYDNGIEMKGQIVLCPEINDGEVLKRSLDDLLALCPMLTSVSIVPVGLTKYREKLYPLRMFAPEELKDIIDYVEMRAQRNFEEHGYYCVYCADEMYLKCGRELPNAEYYDDFQQIENGVGMISSMREEFDTALKFVDESDEYRKVSAVTGCAVYPFISKLVDELKKKWHNLDCNVYPIKNDFFGENIDVTGLVTGGDIIKNLKGKNIGDELIIPAQMLRYDRERFLDDVLLTDLERELDCKVRICENDGAAFISAFLGIEV